MRIRSTKPEFWRSKTIAALPWDVRLVLKGLESYVDDNGVGKDDIALIAADVFPRDLSSNPRETLARLSEAISHLAEDGLIARYEVDGEDLLYIERWKELQRIDKPARGRFRRPDGTLEYSEAVSRENYAKPREGLASPPEVLAPGTGEQGNRGTGDSTAPRKRGCRIPDNFAVTDDMRQWATDNSFGHLDLDKITAEFRDYWAAEAGARAVKLDWTKTWHNRVRAVAERPEHLRPGSSRGGLQSWEV